MHKLYLQNRHEHIYGRKYGLALSPIDWVKKEQAPTCISTGNDDAPPQQSEKLAMKMAEADAIFEHIVLPGSKHDMNTVAANLSKTIDWFETHL